MKNTLIILFLGSLTLFSCDGNTIENGFEMEYIEDFTIFAGLNTVETHIFEIDVTSNYQNYLTLQGLSDEDIETIVPKFIRFSNLNGNLRYDVLSRARVFISNVDGTSEFELAYREVIPEDTQFELDLIPTLLESKEQMSSEDFKILVKLNFQTIPSQSIDTRMFLTMQAVVQ